MNRIILFLFLIVLAAGIVYIYRGAGLQPEKGATLTPKAYIKRVEEKKAARLQAERKAASTPGR